jgi:hypothetical protein
MHVSDIEAATPGQLAPILLAALQRLGALGREGAAELAALVDDDDDTFAEAAEWIADVAAGTLGN